MALAHAARLSILSMMATITTHAWVPPPLPSHHHRNRVHGPASLPLSTTPTTPPFIEARGARIRTAALMAKAKAKKGGKAKAGGKAKGGGKKASGGAAAGGGGFGAAKPTAVTTAGSRAHDLITTKRKAVRAQPASAAAWIELGATFMKQGEYAEAERAFSYGAAKAEEDGLPPTQPGKQMLDAALLTLRGHSQIYYSGQRTREPDEARLEDDFETYDVPPPSSISPNWAPDPDRHDAQLDRSLGKGLVHVSKHSIIPPEECARAIQIAEGWAAENGGWLSDRHASAPTTDMAIKDVPPLLEWFNQHLETSLFPMLAQRFPDQIEHPDQIRVHDAFIVKYEFGEGKQNQLSLHQDESTFSFTIALNSRDEYEGGGTFFEAIRPSNDADASFEQRALSTDAGGCVAFGGKLRHGGQAITKGVRYIIPLFVYLDKNNSGELPGYATKSLAEA